jgi:hypothetical protein
MRQNIRVNVGVLVLAVAGHAAAQQQAAPPPPAGAEKAPATGAAPAQPPAGTAPQAPTVPAAPPATPATPTPETTPGAAPPATEAKPEPTKPEPAATEVKATEPATVEMSAAVPAAKPARRKKKAKAAEEASEPFLGLAPSAPDTGTMPGRFKPSFGVAPRTPSDFRFDFHGYLQLPLVVGINERLRASSQQYKTVFHTPPLAADELHRFEHTGAIPTPWAQLNFSYGNSDVVANVIIAAKTVSDASAFFDPTNQVGINDAFLTFKPKLGKAVHLELDVGAYANRYGAMGEYDLGQYETPVIARIGGVGETLRLRVPLTSDLTLLVEHGIAGQFDKVPFGAPVAGWNGFADANVGSTYAHHAHAGLAYGKLAELGLHYVNAFSRDDTATPQKPDGRIDVFGADARLRIAPYGRLYLGFAQTEADAARAVSGVIRVLNTFGGPGLIREYLGPRSGGDGSLTTVGAQYDVSVGEIVRSPEPFSGYGPDVVISGFALMTSVKSDDAAYDGITKLKYGGEVTYGPLAWLAGGMRYDRVMADVDDEPRTHAIISPRIIFRTDFNAQDQVVLQYSRFFYGSGVVVRTGYPPQDDPSRVPDNDVFSLTARMWW